MLPRPELIAVGVAVAGVVASLSCFGLSAKARLDGEHDASPKARSAIVPEIRGTIPPEKRSSVWSAPAAQSRSRLWVYDVFTPPEIFYDAHLKRFRVTPPITEVQRARSQDLNVPVEIPFGLRLVAVKRMPFRLQLIGFAKTATGDSGLFENKVTGEVFLAVRGETVSGLSLVIEEIEVLRVYLSADGSTNYKPQARALIRDLSTNESITLTSAERLFSDTARATLETEGASGTQREVGAGDLIEVNGAVFQIGDIQASPATVTVMRRVADGSLVEPRTLRLPETEVSVAAGPSI
jgi:hypothetical protein